MADIYKAADILIKSKKLLIAKAKNKDFFVAPGGKIEKGETAKQALVRELAEEFQISTSEDDFAEFGEFEAKAAGHEDQIVHMRVYIVKTWQGEPTPSHEVEKILWVTSDLPADIKVGSIFEHEVTPRLKQMNLID